MTWHVKSETYIEAHKVPLGSNPTDISSVTTILLPNMKIKWLVEFLTKIKFDPYFGCSSNGDRNLKANKGHKFIKIIKYAEGTSVIL